MNINDSNIRPELTFRRLVFLHMQQLTNFPYIEKDFDALTDYELLCLVVKYLNDVIANSNEQNQSITNLYNAFLELQTYMNNSVQELEDEWNDKTTELENTWTEKTTELETSFNNLQTWIDNYFDNLDVQDEIDNKLDEMLKDGVLEQIIEQFIQSTALWCFDNVAAMKAATNFISGSYAKTLGYYNKNDDGGALYKIRELTSGETPDEAFVITITNTNLVAELIVEDAININSLGADNTGTNDSSSKFNLAFTKINDNFYNGNTRVNTVLVNGKYLINNQVTIVPFAKIKGTGFTTFLTNVTGSAFKIDYLSTTVPTFEGNKQDWLQGELINLSQGGLFKNVGADLTNTCIEIGRDSNIGASLPYSRYTLCNFRIYNYNIGILHNKYHNYIGKFNNVSFESNNIGVQYGLSDGLVNDSGENMSYTNCLFASGTDGLRWLVDGFDSSFVNCSFDFLTNVFNDTVNRGFKRISLVSCHLEGFTTIMPNVPKESMIDISYSTIFDTKRTQFFDSNASHSFVNLNNNKILMSSRPTDPEKIYQVTNMPINLNNNKIGHEGIYTGFLRLNNMLGGCFDNLADGQVTIGENAQIGNWTITAVNTNIISNVGEIVTDNYLYTGHKSLVLKSTSNATTNKTINIQSDFIPVKQNRIVYTNAYTYNSKRGCNIIIREYDSNKSLIATSNSYHYNYLEDQIGQNNWYSSPYGKELNLNASTQYIKIEYLFFNLNGGQADEVGTIYKIGGMCCN